MIYYRIHIPKLRYKKKFTIQTQTATEEKLLQILCYKNIRLSLYGLIKILTLGFKEKAYEYLELAYNELTPFNLTFKTGVRKFYNILTAGISP